MQRRWRLFPKYALLIATVVGAMLVASGVIGVYFSWRETEANLVALQVEKAESAASRIEQYIVDIAHQISWTGLPPASVDGDALEERRYEYQKLSKQVPAITEVAWIDGSGREQLRISRLAMNTVRSGIDLSQEPKFREASAGRIYYSPVYFRKGTEPYMTIARPAGGGVTAAEVNLKFVWDVVSRIRIGEAGRAYVIDAEGSLIAHPDISLVLRKTDLSALPQVVALRRPDAKAQPLARGIAGEPVLSAHAAIGTLHWTVFVESPEAEAFAPLYASILRAALLLGAGLLLAMAASFFVARALVRPLQALQEGAARIGAGELDRRIEVKTGDELEGVAEQFNKMGAALKESYANLEGKVAARTAELSEALEQQTATAEILAVISRSPGDVQPVFEAIATSAYQLLDRCFTGVLHREGEGFRLVAMYKGEEALDVPSGELVPLDPQANFPSRVFASGEMLHIPDWSAIDLPVHEQQVRASLGMSSSLMLPLLRGDECVAVLFVGRQQQQAFTEREVALAQSFVDQAAIAIENVRLFNETKEALEHQITTSEVLQAISNSVADTAPVFDRILAGCERLFAGDQLMVFLVDDEEQLTLGAIRGPDLERIARAREIFPVPLAGTATEQAIRERRLVTFADVLADPDVPEGLRRIARQMGETYAVAVAPMLWEGRAIGSILVGRQELRAFDDKEQRLLRTFADQAVIAIQNARLFNETREALDRQTATAEVLQVISNSVSDVKPVFDIILDSCARLFNVEGSIITLVGDDGKVHLGAVHAHATSNLEPGWTQPELQVRADLVRTLYPIALAESGTAVAFAARRPVVFADVLNGAEVPASIRAPAVQMNLNYSMLMAPLMNGDRGIGAISLTRRALGDFSEKERNLLKTFADQAVIAIQNARLFNETKEALEQQTATAEVLQVISSSVADTQPVFDKILDSCERLFATSGLGIYLVDEAGMLSSGGVRASAPASGTAAAQAPPAGIDLLRAALSEFPRPIAGTATEIAIRSRAVVHFADALADPGVPEPMRRVALATGSFSIALAPMLWEGRGVGAIQVSRQPPGPFSSKELGLLKTFADQAVIAIQNARLFTEIQAKSRELEQANRHKSEFLANMSHELRTPLNAIIGFSEVLSEKMFGEVDDKQLEYLLDIHSSGQHLLTLINDILDLSKIEAGRMELDLASTNLPMLLDNCTTLLRERASRQGLVLALEVESGLAEWVADVRKLKQVVINLLSNAVKFTPAGGRVTLRARRLEHAVEIAVVDTGVGIAEDQQALVFEEFRQAGGDYLRKAEGTGLGLSLARRFVELHGGTMRVESKLGQGSTFAFILPERVVEAV